MDGLDEKLVWDIPQIPQRINGLLREYAPVVERVEIFGSKPCVYLVGETHTETKHAEFVEDLVGIISPQAVFHEGLKENVLPGKQHFTFSELLTTYDLNHLRDYFVELVANVSIDDLFPPDEEGILSDLGLKLRSFRDYEKEKISPFLDKYRKSPFALIDERSYHLGSSDFGLMKSLVKYAIRSRPVNHLAALKKQVNQLEEKLESAKESGVESYGKTIKKKYELEGIYNLIANAHFHAASGLAKNYSAEQMRELLTPEILDLFNVLGYLALDYGGKMGESLSFRSASDYSMLRNFGLHDLKLADACNFAGSELRVFDDSEAKSKSSGDLTPREMDQISLQRETKMSDLLCDYMKSEDPEIVLAYCGKYHARTDAPVLISLRERKIPYCVITLKEESGDQILQMMRGLSYNAHLEYLRNP